MSTEARGPFDFFQAGELPAPVLTETEAEQLVSEGFGRTATARSLGSQQDANFLLSDDEGSPLGVLKIANGAFAASDLEAQDEAAAVLAAALPALRIATVLEQPDSIPAPRVRVEPGGEIARILRFLPGGTLTGSHYLSARVIEGLGGIAGSVSRELADFDRVGVHRTLQWDLRHATRVIDDLLDYVTDPHRRSVVSAVRAREGATIDRLATDLPVQVIHGDITDDNVVRSADEFGTPDGLIDFGDLNTGFAVAELAVAISSILHHDGATPVSTLPAIDAFDRERRLTPSEIEALWPLVLLRGAVLVVSGCQQAAIDADNEYATAALEREWRILENALSIPAEVMGALVAEHLGYPAPAPKLSLAESAAPFFAADTPRVARLDLSADADAMDGGAWLDPELPSRLASGLLADGFDIVATELLQPRLTGVRPLHPEAPLNTPTGIDVWFASDTTLLAPWGGNALVDAARGIQLEVGELILSITAELPALAASGAIAAGAPLVEVPAGTRVRLSISPAQLGDLPEFVPAAERFGWAAVLADPSALLGIQPTPTLTGEHESLLQRRDSHFASVQEHYYRHPPRIERGWRQTLIDIDGRCYLDMVNNVAALGHAHPGVERAATRQLRRFNSNSRFNYSSVVEFSERLSALLPPQLDTVFLVNSGSEAVDLALRIALATTGRPDVLAVGEAYHGWTLASDAVSTSIADNPDALETRPDWVHVLDAPNHYRGRYRDAEVGRYADDAVKAIDELAGRGHPLAAFIGEPFYGNAGGMPLPDGYLDHIYRAVRAHGGLAIADEVQVGYGRLGEWFWGFEQQGVVPDIVTVAKAMGNGHPLGAVITSREVAERYRNQGYFFSSAGGSPVSSVIGLAVLDAIRDEGLQQNALEVGSHLKRRLEKLSEKHSIIGAVHGSGLYLGVELVRDRVTREPATTETAAICERMLELGVVIQPTGDRLCVLKTKPPLCLDVESADYFVDALDRVLTTGY